MDFSRNPKTLDLSLDADNGRRFYFNMKLEFDTCDTITRPPKLQHIIKSFRSTFKRWWQPKVLLSWNSPFRFPLPRLFINYKYRKSWNIQTMILCTIFTVLIQFWYLVVAIFILDSSNMIPCSQRLRELKSIQKIFWYSDQLGCKCRGKI